jgi:hypothetical protein
MFICSTKKNNKNNYQNLNKCQEGTKSELILQTKDYNEYHIKWDDHIVLVERWYFIKNN